MLYSENRSVLKLFGIMAMKAMKKFDEEEKLLVRYGRHYTFPNGRYNRESQ